MARWYDGFLLPRQELGDRDAAVCDRFWHLHRQPLETMMTDLPPDLRPKTYAATELFLDVLHALRTLLDADLESIAIYLCVAEATVRPVVADPATVERLSGELIAPEELRGSITMLLVSDRLGLPRETVRRKVKKLVQMGLLYQDGQGRFRSTPTFEDPKLRNTVAAVYDAVVRYRQRLARHGIEC